MKGETMAKRKRPPPKPDIVGPAEIATLCDVNRTTVDKWRWQGRLPAEDYLVSGRPLWLRTTIEKWDSEGRGRKNRVKEDSK